MYLNDFTLHRPSSLAEAIKILSSSSGGVLKAGGTDLLVEMKKGLRNPEALISLTGIRELKEVADEGKCLVIGAGMTHSDILRSEVIGKFFPAFTEAVGLIGSEQVRNSGTLGGNLCTAAACCDSAPVLITLDADLEIAGPEGKRMVALKDFFVHNRKTLLEPNEILTKIVVPKSKPGTGIHYTKFGLREGSAVAVVSVAVKIVIENEICKDVCIVVGAVAPTPLVSHHAVEIIKGKNVAEIKEHSSLLARAGKAASEDSVPIDDVRGGAQFRRNILNSLTQRTILTAIEKAKNE